MSTVRPFQPPVLPAARPSEPARPAQRAFFQAAQATPPEPKVEPVRRVESRPADRLPRPGSLLDIKV